jgi:flagellar basal body-associated protein FliL
MKICPKCEQTFNDDSLGFCLLDGTALVSTESQATVVIDQPTVPMTQPMVPKKSNTALWVGLIIVVMLFGIVAVAFTLMYFLGGKGDTAANRANNVNTTPTPRSPATPKPTPSAAASASPSPTADGSKPTPQTDDANEVTPIAWNTSGATFKSDVGLTYKFQCPESGTPSAIWGSDIYTADSSICTAAVHAGIISLEKGGTVTIEFRPGRATYGSTVRNGITSNTFGEFARSFVVR